MSNLERLVEHRVGWEHVPLCIRYKAAVFTKLEVRVHGEEALRLGRCHWGIGVVERGEHEVLGVWAESHTVGALWQGVADDLKARGVKTLGLISSNGVGCSAFHLAFPTSAWLPAANLLVRQIEPIVSPRNRSETNRCINNLYAARTSEAARAVLTSFSEGPIGTRSPELVSRLQVAWRQIEPLYLKGQRTQQAYRAANSIASILGRRLNGILSRRGAVLDMRSATSLVSAALVRADAQWSASGGSSIEVDDRSRREWRSSASDVARKQRGLRAGATGLR